MVKRTKSMPIVSDGDVLAFDGGAGGPDAWWADVSEAPVPARGPDAGVRRPAEPAPDVRASDKIAGSA